MTAPTFRRVSAAWFLTAAALMSGACASNLKVKKVPLEDRANGTDHQQGFRYYLNRPYLVVKQPIVVTETVSLVRVIAPPAGAGGMSVADPADARVTFLDGPRRGAAVRAGDLQLEAPGSGVVRAVTPDELHGVRAALAARVVPAQAQIVATEAGVSVPADAGALADVGVGGRPGAAYAETNTADLSQPTVADRGHAPDLTGNLAIVYMPDLDEQYVIRSKNRMAKTAFGLAFRNGSELAEVQGEHDSTTVTLAVLDQVQKAIGAVAGVEEARIKRQAKVLQAQQPTKDDKATESNIDARDADQQPIWRMVERTSIKPGVYRLNKPWEAGCGPGVEPVGCGLLAKLGLPTVVSVDFVPVTALTNK